MLSIIVCSVSPSRLAALERNISETIGLAYEIVAIGNREKQWSIAKVYNYAANKAKYSNLFFVHEDVKFHSKGWGSFIIRKLMEPDCGVIGFAGSKMRTRCYAGWCQSEKHIVSYLYQGLRNGLTAFSVINVFLERAFEEVVVLDGLGLFVRKEVWERFPFDEEILTGFHCYDIDFTLKISVANFKNYVCCSNEVLIEHFSLGNFDGKWFSATIRMHKKWEHILPLFTNDIDISKRMLCKYEEGFSYDFLSKILKSDCASSDKRLVLKEYWLRPFSWKHLKRCILCSIKFLLK